MTLYFRPPQGDTDTALLAELNRQLIRDEAHRNPMNLPELEKRMKNWLADSYEAVIFSVEGAAVGYALFRFAPDYVYLRHFFIASAYRRQGLGRRAFDWLRQNRWQHHAKVRVEVLSGNARALAFWRSVGFEEYAVTLELNHPV